MKKEPNWDESVNRVMNSLEGISRAKAPEQLYTRIRGRLMEPENGWSAVARILSRPLIAFSMSLLLLVVNGWIIFGSPEPRASDEGSDQISALAQEYHLDPPNLLDQNNHQP